MNLRVLAAIGVLMMLAAAGCQKSPETRNTSASPAKLNATPDTPANTAGVSATKSKAAPTANPADESSGARPGKSVSTLTAADDSKEINLRQGQVITVVLDANRAKGFKWVIASPAGNVIQPQGDAAYAVKAGHGAETWRFRAVKPGRQTVRLEYRREWTQNMPERTFRFTAMVQ